jgi:DNA-binding MarR family transcriptional regulator
MDDTVSGSGNDELGMVAVEAGLDVLLEACDKAVEELEGTVPGGQLRALLIIDRAGSISLGRLAGKLGASASATSRLCDRLEAASLLTKIRAAGSRREIAWHATEAGRRLAAWIRERRRAAISAVLGSMRRAEARDALAGGLRELAAGAG